MSTRANVVITDSFGHELWFYRHSDGYPEGSMPTLEKYLDWVKAGRIRDNASQSAGWLILIGCQEYANGQYGHPDGNNPLNTIEPGNGDSVSGWKIGSYEPTTGLHGDIEYLYRVDLANRTIKVIHQ